MGCCPLSRDNDRFFHDKPSKAGFIALGFEDWGQNESSKHDALNDTDSDRVDTRLSKTMNYDRDARVRAVVILRAAGKCEYCGAEGFVDVSGSVYLVSHHIVHLAKDGKDKRTNVIALCPNHHRETHFGMNRDVLEQQMTAIVAQKDSAKKSKLKRNLEER